MRKNVEATLQAENTMEPFSLPVLKTYFKGTITKTIWHSQKNKKK